MTEVVVLTKCPHCGRFQNSRVVIRKRCVYCGKSFILFPKGEPARVYKIMHGNYTEYMYEANKVVRRLNEIRSRNKLVSRWYRIKSKEKEKVGEVGSDAE